MPRKGAARRVLREHSLTGQSGVSTGQFCVEEDVARVRMYYSICWGKRGGQGETLPCPLAQIRDASRAITLVGTAAGSGQCYYYLGQRVCGGKVSIFRDTLPEHRSNSSLA